MDARIESNPPAQFSTRISLHFRNVTALTTHEPQVLQATPHIVGHMPNVLGHKFEKVSSQQM